MANVPSSAASAENTVRLASVINALPVVLNILAGVFLWLRADSLAGRMVKNTATATPPVIIGPEAQIVAFSALGLWTLLQVIPRFGQIAANLYIMSQQDASIRHEFKGLTAPDIVGAVIQLLLGLWLLLGASGLVKLLRSFRTVGMDKQNHTAIDTQ